MNQKTHLLFAVCSSGFLFVLDQLLKWFARVNPDFSWYIVNPWLGWEYLENPGIAFGLPIPNAVLIVITPIILLLLVHWFLQKKESRGVPMFWGMSLIIAGAISNYIDRVLFEVTIDYLRIVTSIINLADVMIVVGAGMLLLLQREKKEEE